MAMVEKTVIDAALASYDSASNGNRNRGGVRKAAEMYVLFYSARYNYIKATDKTLD